MKRALSVSNIIAYKPRSLDFTGEWEAAFGRPELSGAWLVWGASSNGKTRFAMQLCKYLAQFGKVLYDSLEEGISLSIQRTVIECGMADVSRRFMLLDKEPITELRTRLDKRNSADVVVIDSLQYTGMTYADYKLLRDTYRDKLFILISHASGKEPKGGVAESIRFDASVKVRVEGFRAFAAGRYGGGAPFTIWHEGAARYWGENTENNNK